MSRLYVHALFPDCPKHPGHSNPPQCLEQQMHLPSRSQYPNRLPPMRTRSSHFPPHAESHGYHPFQKQYHSYRPWPYTIRWRGWGGESSHVDPSGGGGGACEAVRSYSGILCFGISRAAWISQSVIFASSCDLCFGSCRAGRLISVQFHVPQDCESLPDTPSLKAEKEIRNMTKLMTSVSRKSQTVSVNRYHITTYVAFPVVMQSVVLNIDAN